MQASVLGLDEVVDRGDARVREAPDGLGLVAEAADLRHSRSAGSSAVLVITLSATGALDARVEAAEDDRLTPLAERCAWTSYLPISAALCIAVRPPWPARPAALRGRYDGEHRALARLWTSRRSARRAAATIL